MNYPNPAANILSMANGHDSDKNVKIYLYDILNGGKKSKLKRTHFESFGKELGLTDKQINGVFGRFYKKKADAIKLIKASFIGQYERKLLCYAR